MNTKSTLRRTAILMGLAVCQAIFIVFGPFAAQLAAQPAEIPRHTEPVTWDSGIHNGIGNTKDDSVAPATLVLGDIISVPGVPWIQLQFRNGHLGDKSRIEITSLQDGAIQILDARTIKEWNNRSAYFNGDSVEVRLYVGPRDRGVQVRVEEVVVGDWGTPGNKSICGTADNRVASIDGRVARIDPIGCTGWVISNGKQLTAGHCLAVPGNTTLSFNVPQSLADGTIQYPGPEDQYSIRQSSFQFADGGVGNDWGVFSVYNNPVTGLQPIEVQGSFNFRQDLGPNTIRITGFGIDNGATNQTNQTHSGANAGSTGTTMRYTVDTQNANSGSPVIDVATDEAVGIHTHGGCTWFGGSNRGTSLFNTAVWHAIHVSPLTAYMNGPNYGDLGVFYSWNGIGINGAPPYTYSWKIGNDTVGTGQSVSYKFRRAGTYLVKVTITDSFSQVSTASKTFCVGLSWCDDI